MSLEKGLVSICVPLYNHANFIEKGIKSILEQDYKNIELFVINDGSSDDSDKIMKTLEDECKKRFINFKYIFRPNKGLVSTLVELSELVNGEYFSILYSDDVFFSNKISKQVKTLNENRDYAMCYGKMVAIDNSSNITKKITSKYYNSGNIFDEILYRNYITTPTVMLRTEILRKVGGYDTKYKIDDYPLWLKIAKDNKILFLDEDLVYYRDHDENMTKNALFMIEQCEKILLSWKNENKFNDALSKHYLYSFVQLVKVNDKESAKKYMKKAFPKSLFHPKYLKGLLRYVFI